jgi:hypothetical protein
MLAAGATRRPDLPHEWVSVPGPHDWAFFAERSAPPALQQIRTTVAARRV